jgi:hypothetical protein
MPIIGGVSACILVVMIECYKGQDKSTLKQLLSLFFSVVTISYLIMTLVDLAEASKIIDIISISLPLLLAFRYEITPGGYIICYADLPSDNGSSSNTGPPIQQSSTARQQT